MKKLKHQSISESQLEAALLEYFNYSGFYSFKNFDQAAFRDGKYRKHKFQIRGMADITMLTKFGVIYVEVKLPSGKQSEFQLAFEKKCIENNIRYVVCRSISDGKKLIQELQNG